MASTHKNPTINSELTDQRSATLDFESGVHGAGVNIPADVYNLRREPRRPLSWERPLSAADQAQMDDLRARMDAEQ